VSGVSACETDLAGCFTDTKNYFVSEASVYREPFAASDLLALNAATGRLRFDVLAAPGRPMTRFLRTCSQPEAWTI
jgi:hypothetical protein